MMPDPLDAAFASLANDHALAFLEEPMARHDYARELRDARTLVDAHERAYWNGSLGSAWLFAVRALSPGVALQDAASLPAVARTRDWNTRLLQSQMASWAEYRHDTLAYAAQSYTSIVACSYPDGYVDPYPEFFARVVRWAEVGRRWAVGLPAPEQRHLGVVPSVVSWLDGVRSVGATLQRMAEHERTGAPFDQEAITFLNRALRRSGGCGVPSVRGGWYSDLFFEDQRVVFPTPVIVDVHTQPSDERGAMVGRVLHVATGRPRMMVVAADTCTGPRAYVGYVSSYFERTTERFDRLTDARWRGEIFRENPADPRWVAPIITR